MAVEIRRAQADDAADIAAIHLSSLRAAYAGLIPDDLLRLMFEPRDTNGRIRLWRRWIEGSRIRTVVAGVDGAVAGFCAMHPVRDPSVPAGLGEITAICVHPAHWRHGFGRRLCEEMIGEAHERGLAEVVLWVLESNARARRFYESLRFRTDGRQGVFLEGREGTLHEVRYRRSAAEGMVELVLQP